MFSCADRVYPITCYALFPIFLVIRLSSLAYSALYGTGGLIVTAIRLFMLILMCVLISKKWSPASNYWRGLILLWITRIGVILCLQQQLADAPAELQSMATHVAVVCTGGWMFYSFIEYFLFALSLSIIRPLRLGFSPIPAESIYETLYRHVLILALGVSIAWTVHADQRRDWLRSRSHADEVVHPRRSKTSKPARRDKKTNSAASSAAEKGAEDLDLEGLGECCFLSAFDIAEMREQALQVRGIEAMKLSIQKIYQSVALSANE